MLGQTISHYRLDEKLVGVVYGRGRRGTWFRQSLIVLLAVTANFGCGGSSAVSKGPSPPLSVSVSPNFVTVQEGITQQFTASVNNNPTNEGVTWNLSCGIASGCGSVSASSSPSGSPITYTAPTNTPLSSSATVTVTATSVADTSKSAAATVTVPIPPAVSFNPTIELTHVGGTILISAAKSDTDSLTWSIAGCSGGAATCGSLTSASGNCATSENCFNTYTAPATVPTGGQVNVIATSVTDPTISASETVLISGIGFASTSYSAGNAPESVAVADFNGDGILDLAVADNGDPSTGTNGGVCILLGNGDGTFQPAQMFSAGQNPTFVSAGDFNGDGKMDLVVSDQGNVPSGGNGNLSVLLGNGDGTFQSPITVSAGVGPYTQALGDFNGDGKLDIAVIDLGNLNGTDGTVYILLGNGDGTFRPATLLNAGNSLAAYSTAIVAGDFNGDGKLDLAVTTSDSNLSVFLGNGDGTFQTPVFYPVFMIPTSLTAGDLRNTGKTDLALTALICTPDLCGSSIQILFGNGDGTFQSSEEVSPTYSDGPPSDGPIALCEWQGWTFQGIRICMPLALQVADFDGSGNADLVGLGGVPFGGLFVLPGTDDGSYDGILGYPGFQFQGPWPVPGGRGAGLVVADFNGDGKPDIVSTWQGSSLNPPNVTVLLNQTVPFGALNHTKEKSNVGSRK